MSNHSSAFTRLPPHRTFHVVELISIITQSQAFNLFPRLFIPLFTCTFVSSCDFVSVFHILTVFWQLPFAYGVWNLISKREACSLVIIGHFSTWLYCLREVLKFETYLSQQGGWWVDQWTRDSDRLPYKQITLTLGLVSRWVQHYQLVTLWLCCSMVTK